MGLISKKLSAVLILTWIYIYELAFFALAGTKTLTYLLARVETPGFPFPPQDVGAAHKGKTNSRAHR